MNAEERPSFIEYLISLGDTMIFPEKAERLLMEAGLDEEIAYFLAKTIVNGTKIRVVEEVKRSLVHTLKTV